MLFALASFALAGIPQGSVGLEVEAYGEHKPRPQTDFIQDVIKGIGGSENDRDHSP